MSRFTEGFLSVVKYLLAILLMLSGILTIFSPGVPVDGALGFIYSSRVSLFLFGAAFFTAGAILFYGKIMRSRKWTGRGLMAVYLSFLFATLVNLTAFGFYPVMNWLPNALFVVSTAALWYRWKTKTTYVNPNHFIDDLAELHKKG